MDTAIDAAETFELLDWKRRIFGLYAEARIASDPVAAWLTWRKVRDELFRTHLSLPIPIPPVGGERLNRPPHRPRSPRVD